MAHSQDLAVLVISCDKFSSWWDLFFNRMKKFWPDCSFNAYLLTNKKPYERKDVTTISVGEDRDWSSNLLVALESIEEEYLLLMLEDSPFDYKVDNYAFLSLIEQAKGQRFNYLNLKASPRPVDIKEGLGKYPAGMMYRTALIPCVWKKSVLKELLVPGESAWQFEIRGSSRSNRFDAFFATSKPVFQLLHCVIKGAIDRRAYKTLKETGELSRVSDFKQMLIMQYAKLRIAEWRGYFIGLLPYVARAKLRRFYYGNFLKKTDWV